MTSKDTLDAAKRMEVTDPLTREVFCALYDENLSDAGYLGQDWCKRLAEKVADAISTDYRRVREAIVIATRVLGETLDTEFGLWSSPTNNIIRLPTYRVWSLLNAIDCTTAPADPLPINMILHCPTCHVQHIDAPSKHREVRGGDLCEDEWTNPPHRSHLCSSCGATWRPADVPTNGVTSIKTKGKKDT